MTRFVQGALVAAMVSALFATVPTVGAQRACPTGDCIQHEITSQSRCTEQTRGPQRNAGWDRHGLSTEIDSRLAGGNVVAYKIRWSSGWSDWFVTGVNDIDIKYDVQSNQMRRMWAYFTDHQHTMLICR